MQVESKNKIYTVEEYIKHEWTAERRSEFINGQLFEMPGEKDINNSIALKIAFLLMQILEEKGYKIYAHDVKVKIFGENKYYYPDVFLTRELNKAENEYIKFEPELIVEVVSETSNKHDYVDKYIDYAKIPSLLYYLIIEPETTLITCYKIGENGEWLTSKYTRLDDTIKFDEFDFSFQLKQLYPKNSTA